MERLLKEARKTARAKTATPAQIKMILDEPGDIPSKIVESCKLVVGQYLDVIRSEKGKEKLGRVCDDIAFIERRRTVSRHYVGFHVQLPLEELFDEYESEIQRAES